MPLNIKPIIPHSAIPPSMVSASKHVQNRRLVEVQPQSQVSYSEGGNSQIVFDINSPSDFWDMVNSYLRFQLTCDLSLGGSNTALRYLAEGGGHALFKTITVETQSGTLIQRIDRANRLYSIMSSASHSPEHVDYVLGRAGDSAGTEPYDPKGSALRDVTFTAGSYDASTGIVTLTGGLATSELQLGDVLFLGNSESSAFESASGIIKTITSDTAVVLYGDTDTTATDPDLAALTEVKVLRARDVRKVDPMRKLACNTDNHVICLQPYAPFLRMHEWFPLFLVRGGLRVTLTLERPEFVLCCPAEGTFSAAAYTIDNPVWCCSMVTPDQSLSQQYLDMYKSSGIAYNFIGYRHYLDIQSGGLGAPHVTQINANVRSARHILGRIQNLRANTVTALNVNSGRSTITCDSIAQGLKANLQEYQFQAGSERFPQARPINCTDISNSEAFSELERVMSHMGASNVFGKRFEFVQWAEVANWVNEYESTQVVDSQRFIVSAELARDPTPWAGLDLSLNALQATLNFDAIYYIGDKDETSPSTDAADRYFHWFLGYDQSLLLSSNGNVVYS